MPHQAIKRHIYGFRTPKSPPPVPQLKSFETDILKMVEDTKFRKVSPPLQATLKKDINTIQKEKKILVPAEKINNYYKVTPTHYNKLLMDSVTASYKKADEHSEQIINANAKRIAEDLDLDDRIHATTPKPSFITLKDHKDNFRNHPTCRLINPCKSEIGKISKQILDRINSEIVAATQVNQWKNSFEVIDWFKAREVRKNSTFLTFDVNNFYPSITKTLLNKALDFAKLYTTVTTQETDIILSSKDTLLFHDNQPWQKAYTTDLFDVTMGSFDGAETCELVGSFILSEISNIIPRANIGLYRCNG